MSTVKMHDDEFETNPDLVTRLIAAQFPQWADRAIERVASAGTDNALYRLGDDMVVRLPRIQSAAGQVDMEQQWLPMLAPHLPLEIPAPLALGVPAEGYPWRWSVYSWLEGENATQDRMRDPGRVAKDLAKFVTALHRINSDDWLPAKPWNTYRGVPLAIRDESTRVAIEDLHGVIDTDAATAAWDFALQVPDWQGPPVWIHGDLQSGNLLVVNGQLSAVIDFGCLAVGDPATDLIVAWNLFCSDSRAEFRAAVQVDDATWDRGRGWALSTSLIALPYYQTTNPVLAGISRYAINEVLTEHASGI